MSSFLIATFLASSSVDDCAFSFSVGEFVIFLGDDEDDVDEDPVLGDDEDGAPEKETDKEEIVLLSETILSFFLSFFLGEGKKCSVSCMS